MREIDLYWLATTKWPIPINAVMREQLLLRQAELV
jgi:hypothetical protein